ncbi:helix-turn-helix domain-containing protein [Nocardioides euryhalodurans]|uniref:LuxR family transcriptional regulator n=1 Tax=Nocardioides euryhalodurans TaxID=2518370 RepID=A0A4P7GMK4_9ACTN|nr:helix-turn-helix transcriptional regulator [Nocardioides euryhalodurans]QBR93017.1 LuxR family transcriptional regulator [Nocardioides euryhalodurans]
MLVTPTSAVSELVRAGRIADALAVLATGPEPSVAASTLAMECRLARGEIDLALGLGEALADAVEGADGARAAHALGELAAATGRDDDAVGHFLRAGELATGDEDDPVELPWRAGAALSLIRLGRHDEAQQHAQAHRVLAARQRSAYALAGALRTIAAVGAGGRREDLLREARTLLGDGHARLAATIDTDLAGLLALMGGAVGRQEAVVLLRSAEVYADIEDLWPLHGRVRRLLERLGEQPATLRCEAIARLTDLEHHLSRLAGTGSSNRQIAEQEGLTVKAVEWHLSRAYRKLGIRSRRELPRSLKLV